MGTIWMKSFLLTTAAAVMLAACGGPPGQAQTSGSPAPVETRPPNGKDQKPAFAGQTRAPEMKHEYSNLGYAILGRVIANVTKAPYRAYVERTLLTPLGMTASGFDVFAHPKDKRALGYRWENDAWAEEPTMKDGAFNSMGGLEVSATDYARWLAFVLSAWPPRNDAETGPVRRATVRRVAQGLNFSAVFHRYATGGDKQCPGTISYGMGWRVIGDCDYGTVLAHGGEAVMTRPDHPSGSDRIFEALGTIDPDGRAQVIVNLQGDLPTIDPEAVRAAVRPLADPAVDIATLAAEIVREEEKTNPNVVKVVGSPLSESRLRALYFTRATAPWGEGPLYHHIGLYAWRRSALARFVALPPSTLERRERLEQLRALEAGMRIDAEIVSTVPLGVDTPEDLERAREILAGA